MRISTIPVMSGAVPRVFTVGPTNARLIDPRSIASSGHGIQGVHCRGLRGEPGGLCDRYLPFIARPDATRPPEHSREKSHTARTVTGSARAPVPTPEAGDSAARHGAVRV